MSPAHDLALDEETWQRAHAAVRRAWRTRNTDAMVREIAHASHKSNAFDESSYHVTHPQLRDWIRRGGRGPLCRTGQPMVD